jgi:hypothetical protein
VSTFCWFVFVVCVYLLLFMNISYCEIAVKVEKIEGSNTILLKKKIAIEKFLSNFRTAMAVSGEVKVQICFLVICACCLFPLIFLRARYFSST